jgi:ferric-dicitrate binding protein FerR (iron transport regulator)
MRKRYAALVVLLMLVIGDPSSWVHADGRGGNDAVVTLLQGSAWIYSKGEAKGRVLKKGSIIKKNQEVRVAGKSRLEMRFPDGTVMRLSEKTNIKMSELSFDKKTESKKVYVNLSLGKLWAKVKKLATPDSSVEVQTSNAVAGVRGTVYRVNVEEDKSALVKVYDGTVYVTNPSRDASKPVDRVSAPHPIPGPNEVPPPYHEVSMEEWTAIVTAMQQITISSQGVPSKPQDFDPREDQDDWVRWNQQRDKEIAF